MVLTCVRSSRNNLKDLKDEFLRFNKKNGGGELSSSELKKGFTNLKVRFKLFVVFIYSILYSTFMFSYSCMAFFTSSLLVYFHLDFFLYLNHQRLPFPLLCFICIA